ncbi:MAG: ATP-binding protein [Bacteroidales bacterium]|jgi:predicted AAA+ superfamily ATPase|nr:ATP-binding protein [Bacteroidales bacterium]
MYNRKQILEGAGNESVFIWGARQTGKSTLIKSLFPNALLFDLLLSNDYAKLLNNPALLREMIEADTSIQTVVIDEIQLLPNLLNEIHWLIVNKGIRFIMSGSSTRKILHSGVNLLGGRALRYELYPLVSAEIPDFDLLKALNNGLLPRLYDAANAKKMLSAYIGSYLRDEIAEEAQVRNVPTFGRFLEIAALTNGEMVNYTNIASETGVSANTVKSYFQILEETLLGRYLPSYQKKPKRRVILAPKFYLFDVGIANALINREKIEFGNEIFGKAFEHFIYQELYAHSRYSDINYPISYWRTTSQLEIDFVLGDHEVAIEVKSTAQATPRHLRGLKAFAEEYTVKHKILITNDPYPRRIDDIMIYPWQIFLQKLWGGEII